MPSSESSHPALAVLYQAHHGWLQDWLRRRLGHAGDAADLAQDAFIRLLLKPRPFASGPQARAYLRTMANGLCVDLWRRRQIEQAWLDTLASRPMAYAPSAEEQAAVLQALQEIDTLLQQLPARVASAFVMAVGCDMTDAEVARALGVSDRMVRKYVAQATLHCMLREMAEQAGPPANA